MRMKKLRINFRKDCKMHLACSSDDYRPVMQYIYFLDGFAYASDAHILIKNKLSEITENIKDDQLSLLNGKYLHKSSFQKILDYSIIEIVETGIKCNTGYSVIEFKFCTDDSLRYLNADAVFFNAKKTCAPLHRISLNASIYYKLYQSLYNDDRLVLNFAENKYSGILVKSQDPTIESEAVIMPIRITE